MVALHHEHPHPFPGEVTGPSFGPIVLDIGGEIGAAVVHTGPDLNGHELEIRRFPADWDGAHVAVRSRPGPEPAFAAVFGGLRTGTYELRLRQAVAGPIHEIRVVGGEVVESTWPGG
ncbi:MAG: phospholipase [Acidimicrobiales bacterium]